MGLVLWADCVVLVRWLREGQAPRLPLLCVLALVGMTDGPPSSD